MLSSFNKSIHKFLNTKDNEILFLFVQDPADHPSSTYNGEKNVSIWVPSGRIKVCRSCMTVYICSHVNLITNGCGLYSILPLPLALCD